MNNNIPIIYNSLLEISWHFGSNGINGECCEDLSLVEFMSLKKASENKFFSIQDIGTALSFTKSGATRIVDRLVTKGYVERKRSSVDGRVCCVFLTPKGEDVLDNTLKKYTIYLEEALKDIKPEMVDQIQRALEVLLESVQKHEFV